MLRLASGTLVNSVSGEQLIYALFCPAGKMLCWHMVDMVDMVYVVEMVGLVKMSSQTVCPVFAP